MAKKLRAKEVMEVLSDLFLTKGITAYIRSDNGTEFPAVAIKEWLKRFGIKTAFIKPKSLWENGYIESFKGKLRDEVLNKEIFTIFREAGLL